MSNQDTKPHHTHKTDPAPGPASKHQDPPRWRAAENITPPIFTLFFVLLALYIALSSPLLPSQSPSSPDLTASLQSQSPPKVNTESIPDVKMSSAEQT